MPLTGSAVSCFYTAALALLAFNKPTALYVPGLREMSLRIEIGDIVQLRQLRFNANGDVLYGTLVKDKNGRPVELPRRSDKQHDSVVWGIDRLNETLSLRVDSLAQRSMLFNVCFAIQSGRLGAAHRAAILTQHSLNGSSEGWMRSMLFPEPSDGYYQKTLNKGRFDLSLHDPLLNYEQLKAVNTVLNEAYGPVPYLVSGPPGTGKTKTLVELAMQLISKKKTAHLVICAPSDPAADTLVQRLSKYLKPSQLLRLNAPSRSFPEVPNTILPYCCVDDGMFSLPSFKELMRLKIVATTCRDAEILVRARASNRDLCDLERTIHETIHPEGNDMQLDLHWTGLLVDEAAQASELEALIPLSLVTPPDRHGLADYELPIFVMAGDQFQLGPRTASKTTAMQTSLFERLLDRSFYRDHPLARSQQNGGIMRPLTQDMLPLLRPAFTNLIRNYRSHPAILATPSLLFYNDTLEPEAKDTDSLLCASVWKERRWPILFVTNTAPDEIEQDGGGWYNVNEAHVACRYANSFLKSRLLQPDEICIMSPFRAQVRVLRNVARGEPFSMSSVNIGPLEAFQGLESRLVIICTTRTRTRFLDQDIAKGLGVIHEPRRFNVALTRAKHGLVVVGNPTVLEQDSNWKEFIAFCHRNGLCDDHADTWWEPQANEEMRVSRLEKGLLYQQEMRGQNRNMSQELVNGARKLGFIEDDVTALWRSGVAAIEDILKDGADDLSIFPD